MPTRLLHAMGYSRGDYLLCTEIVMKKKMPINNIGKQSKTLWQKLFANGFAEISCNKHTYTMMSFSWEAVQRGKCFPIKRDHLTNCLHRMTLYNKHGCTV